MTLDEVRDLCVAGFQTSKRRSRIMAGVEEIVKRFNNVGLTCEVWLNGSFLTKKEEPADCDLVVRVERATFRSIDSEQLAALLWADGNVGNRLLCDSYVFIDLEDNDPLKGHPVLDLRSYWLHWFGTSRNGEPKGIAQVVVGASDV